VLNHTIPTFTPLLTVSLQLYPEWENVYVPYVLMSARTQNDKVYIVGNWINFASFSFACCVDKQV